MATDALFCITNGNIGSYAISLLVPLSTEMSSTHVAPCQSFFRKCTLSRCTRWLLYLRPAQDWLSLWIFGSYFQDCETLCRKHSRLIPILQKMILRYLSFTAPDRMTSSSSFLGRGGVWKWVWRRELSPHMTTILADTLDSPLSFNRRRWLSYHQLASAYEEHE